MAVVEQDVLAVRRTVASLERQAQELVREYGDTVDARRLLADVGRLAADLDLLVGPPGATAPSAAPAPPQPREKIPDSSYPPDFWRDAEDEGLGHHHHRPGSR